MISELFKRNKPLSIAGLCFLLMALVLIIISIQNNIFVLGVNALYKPIKFCLSTWIYAWTMAYLLYYINNQKKVKYYTFLAIVVMIFENLVITFQAFRGKLSHFNKTDLFSGILYALMGVMIVLLTISTLYILITFILQKSYTINKAFVLSIKIGLFYFIVFSFFGGYMSIINTHNIGGEMGNTGLPFFNWSKLYGDLRVAHFLGIHSLQMIPLLGYYVSYRFKNENNQILFVSVGSLFYLIFIVITLIQAIRGIPFINN